MAYKKLSEATFVESVSDEATVLVEENDQIKRVPKRVMGKVETVNGVEPDENGNVEIDVELPEALQISSEIVEIEEKIYQESFTNPSIGETTYLTSSNGTPNNAPTESNEVPNYERSYVVITYESPTVAGNQFICEKAVDDAHWVSDAHDIEVDMFFADYEPQITINYLNNHVPEEDSCTVTVAVYTINEKEEVIPFDPKYYPAFMATLTKTEESEYVLDRTFDEIRTALEKGQEVVLKSIDVVSLSDIQITYYRLFFNTPNVLTFTSIRNGVNDTVSVVIVSIYKYEYDSDSVDVKEYLLSPTTA